MTKTFCIEQIKDDVFRAITFEIDDEESDHAAMVEDVIEAHSIDDIFSLLPHDVEGIMLREDQHWNTQKLGLTVKTLGLHRYVDVKNMRWTEIKSTAKQFIIDVHQPPEPVAPIKIVDSSDTSIVIATPAGHFQISVDEHSRVELSALNFRRLMINPQASNCVHLSTDSL